MIHILIIWPCIIISTYIIQNVFLVHLYHYIQNMFLIASISFGKFILTISFLIGMFLAFTFSVIIYIYVFRSSILYLSVSSVFHSSVSPIPLFFGLFEHFNLSVVLLLYFLNNFFSGYTSLFTLYLESTFYHFKWNLRT